MESEQSSDHVSDETFSLLPLHMKDLMMIITNFDLLKVDILLQVLSALL